MFEIINDDQKQIIISLHLEEIYTEMCLKTHLRDEARVFSKETLSKKCIDNIVQLTFEEKKYSDYECFIDFSHIKYIAPNSGDKLLEWIQNLPNASIIHGEECQLLKENKMCVAYKDGMHDYREMFNDYGKKYIAKNCCDPKGYETQIGICLGVYVDIKKIINDSIEMLRWCYIIAYDLDKYFLSVNEDKKNLFFCHTLNGAYIAGILSQLLGYDLVYVDHLGPYNKLNKVDFYKGKSRTEEFIVVADLVCLGNEFLRAKNIVEYLGGTVKGCVGIIQMNDSIPAFLSPDQVNVFALKYTPKSAREELGYSVRTDFCSAQCEHCKKGGTINNGIS